MILLSKYPAVNAAIARLEYLKINRELQKKIKKVSEELNMNSDSA
jgi:hypothetical protein